MRLPSSEERLTVKRNPDKSSSVICDETGKQATKAMVLRTNVFELVLASSVVAILEEQETVLNLLELVEYPELMRLEFTDIVIYL